MLFVDGVAVADDPLVRAAMLLSSVQAQLESEGYPPQVVKAGIERARRTALVKARPVSEDIFYRAFTDILAHELPGVRSWVVKEIKGSLK